MKKRMMTALLGYLLLPSSLFAGVIIDLQGGPVFTGYNKVQIPGDDGTHFSLHGDLRSRTAWSARAEGGYLYKRHYLGALFTPLRVRSRGALDGYANFDAKLFAPGERLQALFRFDSYRMTYRYTVYSGDVFSLGAGFTAKIRDASIGLKSDRISAVKKNTGFVPILNFALEAKLPAGFFLFLGGDALAAPQGRAEDIALLAGYRINENLRIKAGYRMLEGGADNSKVYTFSMFHYAVIGLDAAF